MSEVPASSSSRDSSETPTQTFAGEPDKRLASASEASLPVANTRDFTACQQTTLALEPTPEELPPFPEIPGYQIQAIIGRGGMGIVYQAIQLSLNRKVALKVLPPALAGDEERIKRFRKEAEIAARLHDCRILPVLDVLTLQGTIMLIMPFVDGRDLGRILADRRTMKSGKTQETRHPWASLPDNEYLERLFPVLDMIVESVVVLHRSEVLHRDIKPSNVLLDQRDQAWLTDFGLARLGGQSDVTRPGVGLGTRGYMSPEQWEGREDLDHLADVFGLGACLYHALTLELPYGLGRVEDSTALPKPPSRIQPQLTRDVDAVLLKALEPRKSRRYASVEEFQADWRRVRQGQVPWAPYPSTWRLWIRTLQTAPGLSAVAIVGLLFVLVFAAVWLQGTSGDSDRDRGSGPGLGPASSRTILLATKPPGARVILVPFDSNGELQEKDAIRPQQTTPIELDNVPPAEYLVFAILEGIRFHEVRRTIPAVGQLKRGSYAHQTWTELEDGRVSLESVTIPESEIVRGMTYLPKSEFVLGDKTIPYAPPFPVWIEGFYVDVHEVTVGDYKQVLPLPEPLLKTPYSDKDPVTYVTYDDAQAYAERVGKRLLTEAEYEALATNWGKTRFPWGNEADRMRSWKRGPVETPSFDQTATVPAVFGLFSNVGEWTTSSRVFYPNTDPELIRHFHNPDQSGPKEAFVDARVVRGAPADVLYGKSSVFTEVTNHPELNPRNRQFITRSLRLPGLGFRCARSSTARYVEP